MHFGRHYTKNRSTKMSQLNISSRKLQPFLSNERRVQTEDYTAQN